MATRVLHEKKSLVAVTTAFVPAVAPPRLGATLDKHEEVGALEINYRSASLLPEMGLPGSQMQPTRVRAYA